ncbi:MAG: ABC transporter ATP-binding protein [Thermosphaera sp.]
METIKVEDLWVKYFAASGIVSAVSGVSLRIKRGEILGVVGESGSGKSTLGFALMNMVPPPGRIVKGAVILEGVNLLDLSEKQLREVRGSKISMVFQDPFTTLDPLRRISDQFVEFLMEHGLSKEEAVSRSFEMLAAVGIPERLRDAYPHQLSGGQKQRVSIAMAIALNPSLVIADEPTTALDVIVQKQIMDLIDEIKVKHNVSVMLITHDIALALERSDGILVMYGGEVMEYATKVELMRSMHHPYTRALFASLPKLSSSDLPRFLKGYPPDLRNPPKGCIFHPRCDYAREKCRVEKPFVREVSPGHFVSCHYAGELDAVG